MAENEPNRTRLRFFGLGDYGTYFQTELAFRLLQEFDEARRDYTLNDVVELHHAVLFAEHDLWPRDSSDSEQQQRRAAVPKIRRLIGEYFGQVDDPNFSTLIVDIDFQYHTDVLELLARNRVFDRCAATVVLPALREAKVHRGELLSCQALVRAYDQEVRSLLLSNPLNAEQLVAKYLQANGQRTVHLPKSFTPADSRTLFDLYLDEESPNLNYIKLIANARANKNTGVDAKLKLKAKRKLEALTEKFFEANEGITMGCEVSISENQVEAVVTSMDGMVGKYSYGRRWLEENLDYPTILNNFIYLFDFASPHMLWELPSYYADLGVFERFLTTRGNDSYHTGAAFEHTNQASLLQTVMYDRFLRLNDVELEAVISWFFANYLKDEFGAENLKFSASSPTATYLEKSRHLFSEMESVLKQFTLYVENGELDLELLAMSSEQLSYSDIPSRMEGKYAYITSEPDMQRIQHLLFSDQAGLGYISDELRDDNFARLIVANSVTYEAFLDHQKRDIDFLVDQGILTSADGRVMFANAPQFRVLKEVWDYETVNCYRYSQPSRDAIDAMVAKGWLERRASLLSDAEVSYVNYFLNDKEFSDGPALRNRYLHGSQADGDDDRVHRQTYVIALRLLVALIIKINDDFCLADERRSATSMPASDTDQSTEEN